MKKTLIKAITKKIKYLKQNVPDKKQNGEITAYENVIKELKIISTIRVYLWLDHLIKLYCENINNQNNYESGRKKAFIWTRDFINKNLGKEDF